MGTECLRTFVNEEIVDPSVPPGLTSLTSFILKKMDNCEVMMTSMPPVGVCETKSTEIYPRCDNADDAKITRCLRRKPWINYSQFNSSSEDESDSEPFDQIPPLKAQLPKGVLRGCVDCSNCQKVIARWRPKDACKTILEDAPIFYPTEEEFKDTLKYIASIRPTAERYGICRIVPPSSWNPPCPLKEDNIWKNSRFSTRIQRVDKLQNRDSMKKRSRLHRQMKRKRRRCIETGAECGANGDMVQLNESGYYNEVDNFGFEPGPQFTLEAFQEYADDFKRQYFQKETGTSEVDDQNLCGRQWELPVETIEGEYWRMVQKPTEEIEVLYGADLEAGVFGSGFPKMSSSMESSSNNEYYLTSGWNLNNFAKLPGSVLSFESGDISGVLVPWLYIGMCFSSFCWHVEDHHFYSMNYMHWGAPKIWYGVPGEHALKLEAAMRKHLPDLFEEQPDLLHKLVTQLSPSILLSEGVPVYRCVQNPGEFVLTFPRAYHCGFNCGFNCAEAVNVAPLDWLPHGQNAIELYREQVRKTSVSHDKMLLGAAREAVRAQWELSLLRKNTQDNLRWKEVCGKDGVLAKAVMTRVEMERMRRELLCTSSCVAKMDVNFDATCERECITCYYDLHLSAVSCQCSPERFTCLSHAKQPCACAWSAKTFLFRYEISELNILVEALGGKLSAIYRWAKLDLGLALTSYASKDNVRVTDPIGKKSHSFDPLKKSENGSLDGITSTDINGHPPSLYQETKKPFIQVTSLSDLIGQSSFNNEKKQENSVLDETASTSNFSGPPRLYQAVKAPVFPSSNERKPNKPPQSNMNNLTHGIVENSLSNEKPRIIVLGLSAKDRKYLRLPDRSSCRKEVSEEIQASIGGSPVLYANLSTPVCRLSQEDMSYSEIMRGNTSQTHILENTASTHGGNTVNISVPDEPKTNKSSSPGDGNLVVLSDNEREVPETACLSLTTGEASAKYSEVSARLKNSDPKVSPSNHQNDQVLDTPETNATVSSEGDIKMIAPVRKENHPLHVAKTKNENDEVGNKCIEYNFMGPSNFTKVEAVPQNRSFTPGSTSTGLEQTISDLFSATESSEFNIAKAGSSCLQHAQLDARAEANHEDTNQNKTLGSGLSLTEKANPVAGSSSPIPNSFDTNVRQKGPRLAKVVRRINCSVEHMETGIVLPGKSWSSSQAIFPKGFKSQVSYFSVIDPTKKCFYVSQILDAGLLGPLFMVVVEDCPNEVFIHTSASRCWDMVRDRINQEIRKQHTLGRLHLPPLQPPGSLDGLEMFGFTSPAIIQAIEANDRNKVCTEYWKSRPLVQRVQHPLAGNCSGDITIKVKGNDQKVDPVKNLFKKANPEELHSLYIILSDNNPAIDLGLVTKLLIEEIQNRPR